MLPSPIAIDQVPVPVTTCDAYTNSSAMLLPLIFAGLAAGVSGLGSQVQEVDQRGFNVLETVLPPSKSNLTTVS